MIVVQSTLWTIRWQDEGDSAKNVVSVYYTMHTLVLFENMFNLNERIWIIHHTFHSLLPLRGDKVSILTHKYLHKD